MFVAQRRALGVLSFAEAASFTILRLPRSNSSFSTRQIGFESATARRIFPAAASGNSSLIGWRQVCISLMALVQMHRCTSWPKGSEEDAISASRGGRITKIHVVADLTLVDLAPGRVQRTALCCEPQFLVALLHRQDTFVFDRLTRFFAS